MNEASLRTIMFRMRSRKPVEGGEEMLADAFACLSGMRISDCGEPINIGDYFQRLYCDEVINLRTDCDGGNCVHDILFWLQEHGYVSNGRFPKITSSGINFLRMALELTLEDSARTGDYDQIVYQVSAILMRTLGGMNLKPLVIPSFPLIGVGVFYRRNPETGVFHRFIIPDVLVRLDGYYIPPELGLSRYIAIEIQRSNLNRLTSKEGKYVAYNDPGTGAARRASLHPLYVIQSNRVSTEDGGRKLIDKARKQIIKALEFLPERNDMLFFNVAYLHRPGRLDWLFPPDKEVNARGT
ncbi:MAG: hypothetical protein ACP5UZ_07615 [Thermoplasmata archaeon]